MKKNIIVFVPHQDDEINLVGNILKKLCSQFNVFVIYTSLSLKNAEERKSEAINCCNIFDIGIENIIFLGFKDTPNNEEHFFSVNKKEIVSKIEDLIININPYIIFSTDFDSHSDHRMLCLALDYALFNIKKNNKSFNPIVLKGFCYDTAYYGLEDYKPSLVEKTKIKSEQLSNLSYNWDERISIIGENNKNKLIWNTNVFKALKCHKSQYAILHARSIINSDNVFWLKRIDNLLVDSEVKCTTSGTEKLFDFLTIDTNDISTINYLDIDYSKGLWKPKNKKEIISCYFEEDKYINEIVIYGNPNQKDNDAQIDIYLDGILYSKLEGFSNKIVIDIENVKTRNIEFEIYNYSENFGIYEIGVYEKSTENVKKEVNKILNINNKSYFETRGKKILDYIDYLGFSMIVIKTKIKRKINKIFNNHYKR